MIVVSKFLNCEEKEDLFRFVVELTRKSLDLKQTKQSVVDAIGKAFEADRCFFIENSEVTDAYIDVEYEYLSNEELKSYKGLDINDKFPNFAKQLRLGKLLIYKKNSVVIGDTELDMQKDFTYSLEKSVLESFNVIYSIAFPLFYGEKYLGVLVLEYLSEFKGDIDNYIEILTTLVDQLAIGIFQANLFEKVKQTSQREKLLAEILAKSISTLEISQIYTIIGDICSTVDADRCFLFDLDCGVKSNNIVDSGYEYLKNDKIKSIRSYNFDHEVSEKFINLFRNKGTLVVFDIDKIREGLDQNDKIITDYADALDIKKCVAIPLFYKCVLESVLLIEYVEDEHELDADNLNFLRVLGNQMNMVYNQIRFYRDTQKNAEREALLRQVFESMRSSLDIKVVKKSIVTQVAKTIGSDICSILNYNQVDSSFSIDEFSEYRSGDNVLSLVDFDFSHPGMTWFKEAFKKRQEVNYVYMDQLLVEQNLQSSSEAELVKEYEIKSTYNIPIYYHYILFGYLAINYTKKHTILSEDDLEFLRIIADQAGTALYQASLYQQIQQQAEREKISRNIIEILRSSMDKDIIKKLFVKNIGKFFGADRVFFSEYNSESNVYAPVDDDSEFLSSTNVKSFVGVNWSNPDLSEHIQQLLNKREVKIPNWEEYLSQNPSKITLYKALYADSAIKSSYSFPVLYQYNVMGYFCIEFTQKATKLSDEDIGRIRSICAQAGIALYHAELYLKAQTSFSQKKDDISDIYDEIKEPTTDILLTAKMLVDKDFERPVQVKYLGRIINSCNVLFELTKKHN